jgi:hypothetical protein
MNHELPSRPIDARSPRWPTECLDAVGVVFVATGRRFVEEAEQAALRVRKTNPCLKICLVSDVPDYEPVFWDDLILIGNCQGGFRDKIMMGLCPYRRFLYLDTDAHVFADLTDFWPMLDRFDFVGHQLFEGHDCPLPGIPDAFPEFQGGVLGFKRTSKTDAFFDAWLHNYDEFFRVNTAETHHYSNVSDQKSLRLTVWNSDLAVGVLGPEYNFTPSHLVFACANVRILHGRAPGDGMEHFERRINARLGNRAFVPRFDAVVSNNMALADLMRLLLAVTSQVARMVGRRLTPRRLLDFLRGNALMRHVFLGNFFQDHERQKEAKFAAPSSSNTTADHSRKIAENVKL